MSATVRRRRRTVEERIGAQLRHTKPGDLAGRGEPLTRDRGAIVSRAGGPSGGDSGTVIEHVTLEAVAGQTIAVGGGTVQWGTILPPPTERRGFRKAAATLAADGAMGDIPIDVAGDLEITLDGRWGDYPDGFKCSGDLVITRTRSGSSATKTISLTPAARRICPPNEIAWDVQAGDTISVTLPNDSGEGQTLAELEIRLRVIEVAPAASTVAATSWGPAFEQTHALWTSDPWTAASALWIWSRADSIEQPAGTSYFRRTIDAPVTGDYRVWLSADNSADLYIDGSLVVSHADSGTSARGSSTQTVALTSGSHRIAVEGVNAATSPAAIRVAIYRHEGGVDTDLIVVSDLDWGAIDNPGSDPDGWPNA